MKCKKIAALALTGVMTLALAAPAFAAGGKETKITGTYKDIEIDVAVQSTGAAVINPYSMPIKAFGDDASKSEITGGELTTAGKITTNPLVMYNKTAIDLSVGATVTATIPTASGIELVAAPVKDTVTDKQANVYFEAIRDTTLAQGDVKTTADATTICSITATKVITAFNSWPASTFNKSAKNQILVTPGESSTKENIAIMSAGTVTGTGSSAVGKPNTGSFVLYRLGGTVAKKPAEEWTNKDTFDVNVAFTFSPLEALKGGTITLADGSTLATPQLTVAAPATTVDFTNATYKWEFISSTATDADGFDDDTAATPTLEASSSTVGTSGSVTVKVTVTTADGNKYVSEGTIDLPTT